MDLFSVSGHSISPLAGLESHCSSQYIPQGENLYSPERRCDGRGERSSTTAAPPRDTAAAAQLLANRVDALLLAAPRRGVHAGSRASYR